ncbi:AbrB family transcriptional regulator [Aquicoccus sp. SCR17]|nr:AbrB family transcriptional regulator [Carideicomes alvinocaridis]
MTPANILTALWLTLVGAGGGALAAMAHMPMPWLTGSMATATLIVRIFPRALPEGFVFPQGIRMCFIAIIGMTIGQQVHPDLFPQVPRLAASLLAVTLFVPLTQGVNYLIFRRLGGYDPATAFFSGSPGGLMESMTMGEQAGADIQVLTLQQFLRIIVVLTVIPFGMSLWHGTPVGSAAGLAGQLPVSGLPLPATLAVLAAAGALGLALGHKLHMPASQLVGPMLIAALLNFMPIPQIATPAWGVLVAQLVIGVSLGCRFYGISGRMIGRGIGLSALSVGSMLIIGALLSMLLIAPTGLGFEVLWISFAPGGVTEMSLIAISLAANPAVVSLHHIYRILLTVVLMSSLFKRIAGRA